MVVPWSYPGFTEWDTSDIFQVLLPLLPLYHPPPCQAYEWHLCPGAILHCVVLQGNLVYCTVDEKLHCTKPQNIKLHCTALHCTALHCIALHCTTWHCIALHCTALHCTALQNMVQCRALSSVRDHTCLMPSASPAAKSIEGWLERGQEGRVGVVEIKQLQGEEKRTTVSGRIWKSHAMTGRY